MYVCVCVCAVVTKSRNLNFLEPSGPVQGGWNPVTVEPQNVGRLSRISLQLCFKLANIDKIFLHESHYM